MKHLGRTVENARSRHDAMQRADLCRDVVFVLRQVAGEGDDLIADRGGKAGDDDKGEQHRREDRRGAPDPVQMQPANSRRQQQREQHRERDGFQHRARKIKPGHDDRADDDARHAADRALLGAVTTLEPRRRLAALVLHPPLHERRTGWQATPPGEERVPAADRRAAPVVK